MQPSPRTPSESARAVRVMPGVSIGTRNARDAVAAQPRLRAREHDGDRRRFGVRHPDLAARDPVAVAVADGAVVC